MSHYPFGEKPAALLGLHLKPDGRITAFAYRRPQGKPEAEMEKLYLHNLVAAAFSQKVCFRLGLADGVTGLFTVEYAAWPVRYPAYRVDLLGMSAPFGTDEIPYNEAEFGGGISRRHDIEANREMDGVFLTGGSVAELILSDVQSQGLTEERYKLPKAYGGLLLTLRVNASNYWDGCAMLEFTNGHAMQVGNQSQAKLVLNATP